MKMTVPILGLTALLLLVAACGNQPEAKPQAATKSDLNPSFVAVTGEYLEELLRLDPVLATLLGDHRYDNRLRDFSAAGQTAYLEIHKRFLVRVQDIDPAQLDEVNRIDREILLNQIESEIFNHEVLLETVWNPIYYNVGDGVYPLLSRDFAPLAERLNSLKGRLEAIPAFLETARQNLNNPPKVHTETAIQQNKGNISLITEELEPFLAQAPEMREVLAVAQSAAVAALTAYGKWLEEELLPSSNGEFRIGEAKYRQKLRHTLASDLTKEDILQRAERDLRDTQEALYQTAATLYPQIIQGAFPEDKNLVIKSVLNKLAEDRPTNETILDLAREKTRACTEFVREHKLVTVPDEEVKLIVMPEFQRGVAIAYCDSPGPFEAKKETFYAISPTPETWSEEMVTSFFREYNNYMLDDLTVHEAMPGHYLQLAHSNKFQAPTKIRAIFSSGTFVEGWAAYAEQLMAEVGYGGLPVKMQQLKMRLRLIINAIIDQKIHTAGMTREEALDMMMKEGFQEEGEASGKWRRACLTSTQLSTYYVGNQEINDIRRAYEAKHGAERDMKTMHDQMLSFGSPPAKYVLRLLNL